MRDSSWFLLPTLRLSDGGLARRLNRVIDAERLISIVLSATGPLVGISFELVHHGPAGGLPPDPRLGRVRVDGRTVCFGLVETSRTSLTFTALSVRADRTVIQALRHGRGMEFVVDEAALPVDLDGMARPLQAAVLSVCDPSLVPIETWLASVH